MTELHPFLARLAAAGAYEPPARPQRPANGTGRVVAAPGPGDPQAARYAATALDREARTVADTAPGTRNDTLNTAAFRMGQLVGSGWLAESTAVDALIDAGMACGLSYAESERTVISGMDAGMRAPRVGVELHQPTPAAYVMPDADPAGDAAGADRMALGGGQVFDESHDVATEATAPATTDPFSHALTRAVTGAPWVNDIPAHVPALWGDGDDVLWSEGEPLLITGPTGVGKTTLGTMLVAGRMGLIPSVLGYPVQPGRRVLVLAMDRPRQIQRAMARLLRGHPADVLDQRLVVLPGPPPVDVARRPGVLLWLAQQFDADTVVLDSLKDAAVKLSDEETGQGLSRAMNLCVANGVDVLAYHHQTKRSGNAQGKPNTLADVYGSGWITAGVGSVILLWGNAGDLVIELSHLKQPAGIVGPLSIGHDHGAGRSFLYDGIGEGDKVLDLLRSGPQTAPAVASWLWGESTDRAAVMRAKRRLDRLVETGVAVKLDEQTADRRQDDGRLVGSTAGRYRLVAGHSRPGAGLVTSNHATNHAESRPTLDFDESPGRPEARAEPAGSTIDLESPSHADRHAESRETKNPQVAPDHVSSHAESRGRSAPPNHAPKPPFRGGVGGVRAREGDQTPWNSHEVEVCARCHRDADRLVPAPGGRRWCHECAETFEMEDK